MPRCKATMEFGDDYGDNTSTFKCMLKKDHNGKHQEWGKMRDVQTYSLSWEGDGKILNLKEEILRGEEQTILCSHFFESTPGFEKWMICNKCGVFERDLLKIRRELERNKTRLLKMEGQEVRPI